MAQALASRTVSGESCNLITHDRFQTWKFLIDLLNSMNYGASRFHKVLKRKIFSEKAIYNDENGTL